MGALMDEEAAPDQFGHSVALSAPLEPHCVLAAEDKRSLRLLLQCHVRVF